MGSTVLLLEDDSIIWIDDDGWDIHDREQLDEVKKRTTWVEAGRILWAITDADDFRRVFYNEGGGEKICQEKIIKW